MMHCSPAQASTVGEWFAPDRTHWIAGMHAIGTGNGACVVDRWPAPRAAIAWSADNYSLAGNPGTLRPADLRDRIQGFVGCPSEFDPLLRATFPGAEVWQRLIYELKGDPTWLAPGGHSLRRLGPADAWHIWGLGPESRWISNTWGGPAGLAAAGLAWGAFVRDELVSLACTFFCGGRCEEIGVVTEPAFRGLGLSVACAGSLCIDIRRRGNQPCWSTSPDNEASMRVADKLGFSLRCEDHLYVIGVPIPKPASRPSRPRNA